MGEKNGIPFKKQYKMGQLLSPVVWSPRRAARLVSKHTKFGITTRRTIFSRNIGIHDWFSKRSKSLF
jgi:hypothetical protein